MLRYTYTSGSLYCCTSGHVTLSKITLSHHGVGVDIITLSCHMGRRNNGVLVCCDSKIDQDCESLRAVFSSFKFLLFDSKTVQWQKVFLIRLGGWIS